MEVKVKCIDASGYATDKLKEGKIYTARQDPDFANQWVIWLNIPGWEGTYMFTKDRFELVTE